MNNDKNIKIWGSYFAKKWSKCSEEKQRLIAQLLEMEYTKLNKIVSEKLSK